MYISVTRGIPSRFVSRAWCTVPFSVHPKAPFDTLLDFFLLLPGHLDRRDRMMKHKDQDLKTAEIIRQDLEADVLQLNLELDDFWEQNHGQMNRDYSYPSFSEGSDFYKLVIPSRFPGTSQLKESSAARVMSMYDAARVITYAILASLSLKPKAYYREIELHAASILSVDFGHQKDLPQSGGLVSMIWPLKVILLASPSEQQRKDAQAAIRRWELTRGTPAPCQYRFPSKAPLCFGSRANFGDGNRLMEDIGVGLGF